MCEALGTSEAIHFRRPDGYTAAFAAIEVQTPLGRVPALVCRSDRRPRDRRVVSRDGREKRVGDIVFAPDMSADLFEKWIGFLAMACSAIALLLLTGVIAYFSAGAAIGRCAISAKG